MRPLALFLSLYAGLALAESGVSPEERRQQLVEAANDAVTEMQGFEEYAPHLAPIPNRRLTGEELTDYILFAEGWNNIESEGLWSEGDDSRFFLRLAPGKRPEMLYIHGRYYGEEEGTKLFVNGRKISEAPLIHQRIELPDDLEEGATLEIELRHTNPSLIPGPEELGQKSQPRRVKFFLVGFAIW